MTTLSSTGLTVNAAAAADDDDGDSDHGDADENDADHGNDVDYDDADAAVDDDLLSQRLTRDQMLETLHEAILSELGCDFKTEETNQDDEENQDNEENQHNEENQDNEENHYNEEKEPNDKGAFSDWAEITREKYTLTEKEMIDDSTNAPKQIEEPDANNLETEDEKQSLSHLLAQNKHEDNPKIEESEIKRKSIHACEHCEATFSNLRYFNKHMAKNHKNCATKHVCNICNHSFIWLEKHQKTIHGVPVKHKAPTIHPCEHCEATFSNMRHFNKHMARSHKNKAKKHICNICNNSVTWLDKHQKIIHGVQEQHFCDSCGKEFKYKTLLWNHVRNVHEVTNDKCDQCSKICKNKPALQKHIKYNHS